MQKIIVGNWKMHGDAASAHPLTLAVADAADKQAETTVVLCPPAILMSQVSTWLVGSAVKLGGQNCHEEPEGAFTGEISAPMLADAGCSYVIVGHSERRKYCRESNETIRRKAAIAIKSALIPIVCIGETEEERSAGKAEEAVARQVKECIPSSYHPPVYGGAGGVSHGDTHPPNPPAGGGTLRPQFLLAYEPVWAIGSGRTPTMVDIGRMHAHILSIAPAGVRVLYGGSVKPENAREIMALPGVSGVLVGGASVKAEEFVLILRAASAAAQDL